MLSVAQLFALWFVCLVSFIAYKLNTSTTEDIDQKYSKTTSFSYKSNSETQFPLVINAWPIIANIRVMNIKQKYQRYMHLPEGEYTVEVSYPGYKTRTETIRLNKHFYVRKIALQARLGE